MRSIGTRDIVSACLLCGVLLGAARTGHAGTITYVGTDQDLGGGWRTPIVPNDVSSGGYLGVDGWFVAGNSGSTQLPSYLTSLIPNGAVFGGNGSYASIDNPATTPGSTPSTLISGTLNPFPGTNQPAVDLTFTFGAVVPGVVQLGLMIDNLDIAAYNPDSMQVIELGGPASSPVISTTSAAYNNRDPDWLLFDIQPQAGGTYEVIGTGGPNGCACLGAASFDTASVPEPSSFGLAGIGVGLLVILTLRRCRLARHCSLLVSASTVCQR
jgi:hypothetical protein